MSERYFILGSQLGILKALATRCRLGQKEMVKVIDEIIDKQFIGNMKEPYKDYEIKIVKKERK